MMDHDARIRALEEKIVRLEEENALLASVLGQEFEPSVVLGLTAQEARLVGCLARRGWATKEQLLHACTSQLTDDEAPEMKIVDVLVCKARKKLGLFGISIETVRGTGYSMTADSRSKLTALCEERAF